MKKLFLLCGFLLMVWTCKKDEDRVMGGYFIKFLPRKVAFHGIGPMQKIVTHYPEYGYSVTQYNSLPEDNSVRFGQFVIGSGTLNFDTQTVNDTTINGYIRDSLDNPIPKLEQQIERDYAQRNKLRRSSSSSVSGGQLSVVMITMEYRITGVRNFKLSAVGAPLFGKPEGESLNDFFNIVKYEPQIIASSQTHNLLMGFSTPAEELPASIDEWLSLQPLAQPHMVLQPNASLGVLLPVAVRFAVEMETDEVLVLRDTTEVFTITD
jgi:hypothetical protein